MGECFHSEIPFLRIQSEVFLGIHFKRVMNENRKTREPAVLIAEIDESEETIQEWRDILTHDDFANFTHRLLRDILSR